MTMDATVSYGASYKELFEDAPVAYHELDARGVIVRVNRAECELLGFSPEEMIGRPIWNFIAGEEMAESQRALRRKLSGEQPLAPFVRQYLTRDLRSVFVEIHDRLIYDESGCAVGIRSALIDVTHRVAAEAALHESQHWLSTILRCLCDAVVAVDVLGMVKFTNPAAEKLTGWGPQECRGRDVDEVLALEGLQSCEGAPIGLKELLHLSLFDTWTGRAALIRRDSRRTAVLVTAAPIATEQNTVLGSVLILRLQSSRCQGARVTG